jgi:hypothetical protein
MFGFRQDAGVGLAGREEGGDDVAVRTLQYAAKKLSLAFK